EYRQWEWRHFHSQLDNASRVLTGHQGPVHAVAFSPDGGRLVSIAQDHTLRLWEVATGRALATALRQASTVGAVGFSPDGGLVASGGEDHPVRLWDAHTGAPRGVCRGHSGPIWALAFSPDGRRLVSAAADDHCRLWDVATEKLLAVSPAPAGIQGLAFTP